MTHNEKPEEKMGWKEYMKKFLQSFIGLTIFCLVLTGLRFHFVISDMYEGEESCIVSKDGEYYFVDLQNEKINKTKHDYIDKKQNGYFRFSGDGKWGFLDSLLREHIREECDECGNFADNLAPVAKEDAWFYIDKQNNIAIDGEFEWASEFENGKAIVKKDGAFYIINRQGEILMGGFFACDRLYKGAFYVLETKESAPKILDRWLEEIKAVEEGENVIFIQNDMMAAAYRKDKQIKRKLIDLKSGNILLDDMEMIAIGLDGCIFCKSKEKWHIADLTTGELTDIPGEDIVVNSNKVYPVKIDGLWGVIDRKYKIVVQPAYDMIGPFESGFASVKSKDGKWGIIDENGKEIIPCEYDFAQYVEEL